MDENVSTEIHEKTERFLGYKLSRHITLIAIWVNLGLAVGLVGPSLPDLKEKNWLNYEEIGRALIGQSVGYFSGGIIGGIIHERFYLYTDVIIIIELFLWASGLFLIPWMVSILQLAAAFFICGFCIGAINSGVNALVLHLWRSNAAMPMHSLHCGFGIGGIIAPQICRQFLGAGSQALISNTSTANFTHNISIENLSVQMTEFEDEFLLRNIHPIVFPFSIIGLTTVLCGMVMIILTCYGTPKNYPKRSGAKQLTKLFNPSSCLAGQRGTSCGLLLLLFLFYNHAVGGENNYREFIFAFSLDAEVCFTKSMASNLSSVFWICFTVGRVVGMILSKVLSQRVMLIGQISGIVLCTSVLAVWGDNTQLVLWIGTGLMGFLVSPLFPSGLAWANLYLDMNSMAIMVCVLGGSTGILAYLYLTGFLLENYGAKCFLYVEVGFGLCLGIIYLILELVASKCLVHKEEVEAVDMPFMVSNKTEPAKVTPL